MADLVEYTLDDGSTVLFESAETNLVALHGGTPDVRDGGRLMDRLSTIAKTAGQVAHAMREQVGPDELTVELGVKVAGEVNAWFFAKHQGEATIKVTLTWKRTADPAGTAAAHVEGETAAGQSGDGPQAGDAGTPVGEGGPKGSGVWGAE